MLELRPNCEWCDKDLPPDASDARICSYECTYCAACVDQVLNNVCATCGGGLVPRPIRPKGAHRPQLKLGLGHHPASNQRKQSRWTRQEVDVLSSALKALAPAER